MEDRTANPSKTCTICGDELELEEHAELLCADCVDAWKREVESPW